MQPHDDAPYAPPAAGANAPARGPGLRCVTLAGPTDLAGFRRACRALWSAQISPERVFWQVAGEPGADLFEVEPVDATSIAPPVQAPAAFLGLCESAILHRDTARFGRLYRLLWRLQVEPALRHDPLDADRVAVDAMAQAVRRDIHDMHAQVRFSRVASDAGDAPTHLAWFEPGHHIVEATAPFFAQRFAHLRWALLTPLGSARWDGHRLDLGAAAKHEQLPNADASEAAWAVLCRSLFEENTSRGLTLSDDVSRDPRRRPVRDMPSRSPLAASSSDRELANPATLVALDEALQRCRECPIGNTPRRPCPARAIVVRV